jgi:hypothetical protein
VLSKLKLPNNIISKALLTVDLKILTPSIIDALNGICPTDEEVVMVKTTKEDKTKFAKPELFIDAIREVNGFAWRLKGLVFTNVIED